MYSNIVYASIFIFIFALIALIASIVALFNMFGQEEHKKCTEIPNSEVVPECKALYDSLGYKVARNIPMISLFVMIGTMITGMVVWRYNVLMKPEPNIIMSFFQKEKMSPAMNIGNSFVLYSSFIFILGVLCVFLAGTFDSDKINKAVISCSNEYPNTPGETTCKETQFGSFWYFIEKHIKHIYLVLLIAIILFIISVVVANKYE